MSEDTFYEDEAINDLQERFKARREEIYQRIELGIPPEPMQIVTPRGVHKSDKLRAFVEQTHKTESRRRFHNLDKDKEK